VLSGFQAAGRRAWRRSMSLAPELGWGDVTVSVARRCQFLSAGSSATDVRGGVSVGGFPVGGIARRSSHEIP
jgi:hypothetical protein